MQLISTGTGGEHSHLLSVSPDGVDAFFYTRDVLVNSDKNGSTVKIYTAREEGGFLHDPAKFPCAASDECHGAGTAPPPPPDIRTQTGSSREPTVGPTRTCRKNQVKRRAKCVRRGGKKGKARGGKRSGRDA